MSEAQKTIFVCEDSPDGIFTGVYDAWTSRLGHSAVGLRIAGMDTLDLFCEYVPVETDETKAAKVVRAIRKRMGEESYALIYQAALADAPEKADSIYRVLAVGISTRTSPWLAHHLLEKMQDPDVCNIARLSLRVFHEAHHYEGFVRFRELSNGVLFSEIHSPHQILPLLGDHFSDRFPCEDFLILDRRSGDCLVHPRSNGNGRDSSGLSSDKMALSDTSLLCETASLLPQTTGCSLEDARRNYSAQVWEPQTTPHCDSRTWYIRKNASPDESILNTLSQDETQFQMLWTDFCRQIAIPERRNTDLQRGLLPLRFRPWMTEMQEPDIPEKEW